MSETPSEGLPGLLRATMMPIMDLPSPPMVEHLLFEAPWPLAVVLVVAAVALLVLARRRAQPRIALASLAALGLAVAVLILAALVTTNREELIRRTHELVDTTAPLNLPAFRAVLDPGAVLTGPSDEVWLTFDPITAELERTVQRWSIRDQDVREVQAQAWSNEAGQTLLDVRTQIDSIVGVQGVRTRWLLSWVRQGEGDWRLVQARWLLLQGHPPTEGMWR